MLKKRNRLFWQKVDLNVHASSALIFTEDTEKPSYSPTCAEKKLLCDDRDTVSCRTQSRFLRLKRNPKSDPWGGHQWIPLTRERGKERTKKSCKQCVILEWVAGGHRSADQWATTGSAKPVDQGWPNPVLKGSREPGFLSHQAETASFSILAGRHGFGLGYHLTRRKPLSTRQDRKPGFSDR